MNKAVNPDMIIIARESRGLTQCYLARSLCISQGKMSKIEHGVLSVSDEMLKKLSKELNYPVRFFSLNEDIFSAGLSLIHHRKRKSISSKTLGIIHAQMNIRRIHLSKLLRAVNIESNRIPQMDVDDYDGDIERIAQEVRANWLMPTGPVKNLTATIESVGGIVIKCDFKTRKLDAIGQCIPGLPPIIFVNIDIPGDRLRFTLAHELGHMIMHSSPRPEMEKEADRFAAEFLMPRKDIRPSLSQPTLSKLANLKIYWKVSVAALLYRAKDLNKITERQYRYLCMQMSKAGYKTREPIEWDIECEKPTLLDEIIDTYQNELNYSAAELGDVLMLNEQELHSIYLKRESCLSVVK